MILRYLKAAFFFSPPIAGMGRIPVNILALLGCAILGLGHPGFWLLGLGVETAYLFTVSLNRRFQRLIDAEDEAKLLEEAEVRRQSLIERLKTSARQRLSAQEEKCRRIQEIYKDAELPAYTVENNTDALKKLVWTYFKLLLWQHTLESVETSGLQEDVRRQIAAVEKEIAAPGIPESTRQSKDATLKILRKRLDKIALRSETLAEIESDLTRIEVQLDLALDNAAIREKEYAITANIELASHLLDDTGYGEAGNEIANLEQTYNRMIANKEEPPRVREAS